MELNSIIFPAPTPSYTYQTFKDKLILVKKTGKEASRKSILSSLSFDDSSQPKKEKKSDFIPCLFLPYANGSDTFLLYFHGNAEDIGMALYFLSYIQNEIRANIIAMEYPGYGIYEGSPSSGRISEDSLVVYDYIRNEFNIAEEKIIIFGRSIGTGPASFLAARRRPQALILMSAYTSIRNIVRTHVGRLLQYVVAERFTNAEEIEKIKCPIFLIHGKKDVLIPYENSKALYEKAKDRADYWFPNFMTHNTFDMLTDLIIPIHNFFVKYHIEIENKPEHLLKIEQGNLDYLFAQEKKSFFDKIFK